MEDPAAGRRDLLLKAILWLGLLFLLFPASFIPLSTGLDASYLYAINALPETGLVFGRDVAFTFGPLGYLLLPSHFGDNLLQAEIFRLIVHLLFAAGLASVLWRWANAAQAACFAGLYLVAMLLGLPYDYQLLLLLALLLGPSVRVDRVLTLAAPVCTVLAVIFSLIKINLGISSLALIASYLLLIVVLRKPGRWLEVGMSAAAFAFTATVCVVVLFESAENAGRWLAIQSELARGYGSAMSYLGDAPVLVAGCAALLIFAALGVHAVRKRSSLMGFWAITVIPVILAFKHGFTRQDAHVVLFFAFLLGVLSLGVLLARAEAEVRPVLAAFLGILIFALPVALYPRAKTDRTRAGLDLVTGAKAVNNLRAMLFLDQESRGLELRSRRLLQEARLPASFVRPVREQGLGVDVVPSELSYLPANGLRWVPNPMLQLYTVYTPELDAWVARHFEGARAPDLLLAEFRSVGNRNMVWDTPETWRAIFRRYEPTGVRPRPGILALRQRTAMPEWSWRRLGEERVQPGRWTRVPASDDWLFAELEMPLSFPGKLAQAAFRVPPVYIETTYEDGRRVRSRFLPETAKSGLLMNYAPRNLRGLTSLWRGGDKVRVVRFRVSGGGLRYYPGEIRVVWRNGRLDPPKERVAPPRPPRRPATAGPVTLVSP